MNIFPSSEQRYLFGDSTKVEHCIIADLNGCAENLKSAHFEVPASTDNIDFNSEQLPSKETIVRLFPNPANDKLFVEGLVDFDANVYDLTGRMVSQFTEAKSSIDVSSLKPGVYMVQIKSAGQTYKFKIVKQ